MTSNGSSRSAQSERDPTRDLPAPRPFLKWAGGKTQLLPVLRRFYPEAFGAYFEPFLGSGAVFFDLFRTGRLEGHGVRLADGNADLVGCYQALRDAAGPVIRALERLEAGHRRGSAGHYYRVRDARFNPMRRRLGRRDQASPVSYPPALAAMLIYLNRTGYNGLFRLNARGDFNVPAGRYRNPRVCDAPNLLAVSEALRGTRVEIAAAPYDRVRRLAGAGDFVYFDPPYAPLSRTARFTAYTAAGFGSHEQERLRDLVVELAARGTHVLLSNSTAPELLGLYEAEPARRAGLRVYQVPARRAINSRAASRGPVLEAIVTNIPPAARITAGAAV